MPSEPWEVRGRELELLAVLEWLYDHGALDRPTSLHDFDGSDLGVPTESVQGLARELADSGYVEQHRAVARLSDSVPPMVLTGTGRSRVDEFRDLRSDRAARQAACRDSLLRWISHKGQHCDASQFSRDPRATFCGDAFTPDEAVSAGEYLKVRGYIVGPTRADGAIYVAQLTDKGYECVEEFDGRIRDFNAASRQPATAYNQTFNAEVSGVVGQGPGMVINQTSGIDADQLREIFIAMRAALQTLPEALPEDDREDLRYAVDDLERLAGSDQPDPGRFRSAVRRARAVVVRSIENATVQAGTGEVSEGLHHLHRLFEDLLGKL